jgi:hypothetical protein
MLQHAIMINCFPRLNRNYPYQMMKTRDSMMMISLSGLSLVIVIKNDTVTYKEKDCDAVISPEKKSG